MTADLATVALVDLLANFFYGFVGSYWLVTVVAFCKLVEKVTLAYNVK